MKKHFAILVAFITAMCMISCSESSDTLSASTAKKLYKNECERLNTLEQGQEIETGYYECNDNDYRYKLRQLAANDLVTYSCEKIKKIKKRYYRNDTIDTYFVTVALTENGQKMIFEEKEVEPTEDEAELKNDEEFDWSQFPEASVKFEEFPEIVKVQEEGDYLEVGDDNNYYDEFQPDEEPSAYDKAKAKENKETVKLKACCYNIVKARNIEKTGDYTASCEFIVEYEDVTPVGRIFLEVYNGKRFRIKDAEFKFYEDKGWVLNK